MFEYVVRTPTGSIQPGCDLEAARSALAGALDSHATVLQSWGSSRRALADPAFGRMVAETVSCTRALSRVAKVSEPGDVLYAPAIRWDGGEPLQQQGWSVGSVRFALEVTQTPEFTRTLERLALQGIDIDPDVCEVEALEATARDLLYVAESLSGPLPADPMPADEAETRAGEILSEVGDMVVESASEAGFGEGDGADDQLWRIIARRVGGGSSR